MKRFLILGALAIAFASASIQEASAWINSRFGIGFNWGWQSGGNSCCGGLFHSSSPCGPDIYHQAVPVYPRPCCCTAPVTIVRPQVFCPPGAGPAAAHGPCAEQSQSFRYQPVSMSHYR